MSVSSVTDCWRMLTLSYRCGTSSFAYIELHYMQITLLEFLPTVCSTTCFILHSCVPSCQQCKTCRAVSVLRGGGNRALPHTLALQWTELPKQLKEGGKKDCFILRRIKWLGREQRERKTNALIWWFTLNLKFGLNWFHSSALLHDTVK